MTASKATANLGRGHVIQGNTVTHANAPLKDNWSLLLNNEPEYTTLLWRKFLH
jgi:hypothetical protein